MVGHELAGTGSFSSVLVTVRSIAGRTVVSSVAVAEWAVFLILPLTVPVLMSVDPAEATTCPVIVYSTVPPAFSDRIWQVS